MAEAEPNPGHLALAELERRVPSFTLVTQNVDGLHERAGSSNVIDTVPPRCGAFLRPDVVWFGEMLPPGAFEAASEADRGCGMFLSIGTSSLVYPAAALPYEALGNGATLVEINPGETPLTRQATFVLRQGRHCRGSCVRPVRSKYELNQVCAYSVAFCLVGFQDAPSPTAAGIPQLQRVGS